MGMTSSLSLAYYIYQLYPDKLSVESFATSENLFLNVCFARKAYTTSIITSLLDLKRQTKARPDKENRYNGFCLVAGVVQDRSKDC
jgi:hypothetical protein